MALRPIAAVIGFDGGDHLVVALGPGLPIVGGRLPCRFGEKELNERERQPRMLVGKIAELAEAREGRTHFSRGQLQLQLFVPPVAADVGRNRGEIDLLPHGAGFVQAVEPVQAFAELESNEPDQRILGGDARRELD